jgi:prepilin-type N-terminal cleavage/methylation domain-containing protein
MKKVSAFTLIELLVVIAIIVVLAAIAVPVLANSSPCPRGLSARHAPALRESVRACPQNHLAPPDPSGIFSLRSSPWSS